MESLSEFWDGVPKVVAEFPLSGVGFRCDCGQGSVPLYV